MPMVVALEGGPRERGLAYGEAARDLIAEAAARWEAEVGADRDEVLHDLVDTSGFRAAAERHTPDLVAEVDGIADGSGVDRRSVWALNLLDEGWWVRRQAGPRHGCSALGIAAAHGQVPLLAQNMDLPWWVADLCVVLDVRPPDGPGVLAPAYAGIVATNALNERGLGVCVNTLSQLPTSRAGVPVAFLIRQVAAQPSLREAVAVLRTAPHASGQNYLVGSPEGMTELECGAGRIREVTSATGRFTHTNHPIDQPAEGDAAPDHGGVESDSGRRLEALRARLAGTEVLDRDTALRMLHRPPLWRPADGQSAFTFYATVMELAPAPRLHLSETAEPGAVPTSFGFGATSSPASPEELSHRL